MRPNLVLKRILQLFTLAMLSPVDVGLAYEMRPTVEEILARAGIEPTIPAMTETLLDGSKSVDERALCALALGRTRDPSVLPTLLTALSMPQREIRARAANGLGLLGDFSAVPALRNMLFTDPEKGVQAAAREALTMIPSTSAAMALMTAATDTFLSEELRFKSIQGLADGFHDVVEPALVARELAPLLNDSTLRLRTAAAITLGRFGKETALPVLMEIIMDSKTEDWLRADAILTIEQLTGQRFGYERPYSAPASQEELHEERAEALRKINAWWSSQQKAGEK